MISNHTNGLIQTRDCPKSQPPMGSITVKTFGRDKGNLVCGWVFAGHQFGAATVTLGAGVAPSARTPAG